MAVVTAETLLIRGARQETDPGLTHKRAVGAERKHNVSASAFKSGMFAELDQRQLFRQRCRSLLNTALSGRIYAFDWQGGSATTSICPMLGPIPVVSSGVLHLESVP